MPRLTLVTDRPSKTRPFIHLALDTFSILKLVKYRNPTMTRSLRLLILEFEDPPVEIFEKYGTYGDTVVHLLRHQLQRVAQDKALQVMISRFDVMGDDAYPDPTDFDAVFIPGSRKFSA